MLISTETEQFRRTSKVNLLTRTECEKILVQLQENDKAKFLLKDFSIEPELKSIGYLGQYYHLTLWYTTVEGGTDLDSVVHHKRLFVKTLPYDNNELCEYVVKTGILKKEITLYATLLKELKKISKTSLWADCLYTRNDLFVIQNLNDLGFQLNKSETKILSRLEMKSQLKGLAQMHASSLAFEKETAQNIGETYAHALKEITVSSEESYFTTGVRAIVAVAKHHPLYQSPEQKKYIEEMLEIELNSVYDMVNPSKKYRNVFCHRDPWGGNILFKNVASKTSDDQHETAPVMFVDFQTCRYCPQAIDVIFALYMNLNFEELKAMESFYLNWYYNCFTEALITLNLFPAEHMTHKEFFRSYREFQLFGLLYRAIAATILCVPNNYLSNLKLYNPELYYKYAYVDRTAEVLHLMDVSQEFREYMHQCVADTLKLLLDRRS